MAKAKKKIFVLIDGHAVMHKGYHAIPFLSTSKGEPTNAIFGFTSILLNAIKDIKPDCLAVTFDLPKPTFRHAEYEEYKAHRKPSPDDLTMQIPRVKQLVKTFNIPIYEQEGYEADDLIGTLALKITKENPDMEVVIVTGDLDILQLVTDNIKVYTMKRGLSEAIIYGLKEVKARYGLTPDQMVDYRGLKGDPSDNIPGVTGIGEKTASDLIQKFGSLDKLYEKISNFQFPISKRDKAKIKLPLSEKLIQKLLENKDMAFFSKKLSTIIKDVEIDFKLEDAEWRKKM